MYNCLNRDIPDEQGFLASGVQLYSTNDITIRENILVMKNWLIGKNLNWYKLFTQNATFPDTRQIHQDHGISIVGSNQTYIYQNFIAGWQIADFGGAVRFTSAVSAPKVIRRCDSF